MSKQTTPFFMIPMTWDEEDQVRRLTPSAQLLLLALIRYCQARRNGGVMSDGQARMVCRQVARGHAALDQLLGVGILESVTPVHDQLNSTAISTQLQSNINSTPTELHRGQVALELSRSCTGVELILQWFCFVDPAKWCIGKSPTAGQSLAAEPRARPRVGAQPSARGNRRERREEENRPPSGSGRFSSARTAPRNASGAARPAPRSDEDQEEIADSDSGDHDESGDSLAEDGPRMSQREAMKAIRKAIGKSSMSSGKPAQMRKYPMELNSLSEPSLPVELNGRYE
jgi:hypothetical protein